MNNKRYCWHSLAAQLAICLGLHGTGLNCEEAKADGAAEVSYSNDIRPIVNNFCTTCHAGENPQGDVVLTSYDDIRAHVEEGDLLQRINDVDDPMPQDGLLPLSTRRKFQLWAEGGFVNEGKARAPAKPNADLGFTPPQIIPVDINKQGFELLDRLQGHWVGSMNLMGQDYEWMSFDFRAIAPSHVHSIFEGGTIGNLFTSFFVTEFKGKRTIMARNGGILNGIYRTSYFVLDEVKYGREWSYYRLVDAYGGAQIMRIELIFNRDTLEFRSYTSRFGAKEAKLHMAFNGKRTHLELAEAAAKNVGFPRNVVAFDLAKGLPKPSWTKDYPQTSASYIWQERGKSLVELAKSAKDPIRIDHMPHIAQLSVDIERDDRVKGKKLLIYLSRNALADERGKFITQYGYIRSDLLDGLLVFSEISAKQSEFTFTYLHPGNYYLTVVADMDADGFPSPGDITQASRMVTIAPKSEQNVAIRGLGTR